MNRLYKNTMIKRKRKHEIKKKITVKKKCNSNKKYNKGTKCIINKHKGGTKKKQSSLQTLLLAKIYQILKHTRQITGLYRVLCLLLSKMEENDDPKVQKFDFNKIMKHRKNGQLFSSNDEIDLSFSENILSHINQNTFLFKFCSNYWKLLCLDFIYEENQSGSNAISTSSTDADNHTISKLIKIIPIIMSRYLSIANQKNVLQQFAIKFGVRFLTSNSSTPSDFYFALENNTLTSHCEHIKSVYESLIDSTISRSHESVFEDEDRLGDDPVLIVNNEGTQYTVPVDKRENIMYSMVASDSSNKYLDISYRPDDGIAVTDDYYWTNIGESQGPKYVSPSVLYESQGMRQNKFYEPSGGRTGNYANSHL